MGLGAEGAEGGEEGGEGSEFGVGEGVIVGSAGAGGGLDERSELEKTSGSATSSSLKIQRKTRIKHNVPSPYYYHQRQCQYRSTNR